jgi:uncharacterized membrane protein
MQQSDTPSKSTKLLILFSFASIIVVSLGFFISSTVELYQQLSQLENIVEYSKGPFYLLGASLSLAAITYAMYIEGWRGQTLTEHIKSRIIWCAGIGLVLLFTTPHALHFGTQAFLETQHFIACETSSKRAGRSKEFTYVADSSLCQTED